MGIRLSFPIPVPKTNISFETSEAYSSSGKKKDAVVVFDKTGFEAATEKSFRYFVEERIKAREAKEKLDDIEDLTIKFPEYSMAQIEDFKFQFMSFDVNQDGHIDYPELQHALNDLGDLSTNEQRRLAFDLIDIDHSDSIDFEEFMELITTVVSREGSLSQAIGNMCKRGTEKTSIVRTLPVERQIQLGLF